MFLYRFIITDNLLGAIQYFLTAWYSHQTYIIADQSILLLSVSILSFYACTHRTHLHVLPLQAQKDILHDFFTHAFDGSGGDNFFDAGTVAHDTTLYHKLHGTAPSVWHLHKVNNSYHAKMYVMWYSSSGCYSKAKRNGLLRFPWYANAISTLSFVRC